MLLDKLSVQLLLGPVTLDLGHKKTNFVRLETLSGEQYTSNYYMSDFM